MHKMTAERPKYRYIERHPRLNSFFESTTMSVTTMMLALTSVIWYYTDISTGATVAMAVLGAFMLGYTVWYWTGRRKSVRRDRLISDLTSYYVYLEMFWAAFRLTYPWALIVFVVLAIAIFATLLVRIDCPTAPEGIAH